MSFQAYLDAIEDRTHLTPAQLLEIAAERGYGPTTKAAVVVDWLKTEYGLGHGHAMAFVHLIKNGTEIGDKHVGSSGSHRDQSSTLWIHGKATQPA